MKLSYARIGYVFCVLLIFWGVVIQNGIKFTTCLRYIFSRILVLVLRRTQNTNSRRCTDVMAAMPEVRSVKTAFRWQWPQNVVIGGVKKLKGQ